MPDGSVVRASAPELPAAALVPDRADSVLARGPSEVPDGSVVRASAPGQPEAVDPVSDRADSVLAREPSAVPAGSAVRASAPGLPAAADPVPDRADSVLARGPSAVTANSVVRALAPVRLFRGPVPRAGAYSAVRRAHRAVPARKEIIQPGGEPSSSGC